MMLDGGVPVNMFDWFGAYNWYGLISISVRMVSWNHSKRRPSLTEHHYWP